jgi:hypothetical protein
MLREPLPLVLSTRRGQVFNDSSFRRYLRTRYVLTSRHIRCGFRISHESQPQEVPMTQTVTPPTESAKPFLAFRFLVVTALGDLSPGQFSQPPSKMVDRTLAPEQVAGNRIGHQRQHLESTAIAQMVEFDMEFVHKIELRDERPRIPKRREGMSAGFYSQLSIELTRPLRKRRWRMTRFAGASITMSNAGLSRSSAILSAASPRSRNGLNSLHCTGRNLRIRRSRFESSRASRSKYDEAQYQYPMPSRAHRLE